MSKAELQTQLAELLDEKAQRAAAAEAAKQTKSDATARLSVKHGDRIKPAERKAIAREIMEENPDFTLATLAEYLGISLGSSHSYVADLLARRKETQKMIALRLSLLGWTQEEIGAKVGLSKSSVNEICSGFSELKKANKNLLSEGHPHLDVAERYNMPLQLVWAIDMEGRTDQLDAWPVWGIGEAATIGEARRLMDMYR